MPSFKAPRKVANGKCGIPVKDADLERLLERLDRMQREVEAIADLVAERLGVDLDADSTEEDEEEEGLVEECTER